MKELDTPTDPLCCSVCGRAAEKVGMFVINYTGHTIFMQDYPLGCKTPGLSVGLGCLCSVCDPADYTWMCPRVKNSAAVCADMVERQFIDAGLADRYLKGHTSYRMRDAPTRMYPWEKHLWALSQVRVLNDVRDFLRGVDASEDGMMKLLGFLDQRIDRENREWMEAESQGNMTRQDYLQEHAAAKRARAIRQMSELAVKTKRTAAGPDHST